MVLTESYGMAFERTRTPRSATCVWGIAVATLLGMASGSSAQPLTYRDEKEKTARISETEDSLGRKDLRLLSLRNAITATLENNLDIAVERYNPDVRDQAIVAQKSAFDPSFSYEFRNAGQDIPDLRLIPDRSKPPQSGATTWEVFTTRRRNTDTMSATLTKKVVTGADVTARYDYLRLNQWSPGAAGITIDPSTGTIQNALANPRYTTVMTFTFEQPLLRGAGVDYNRSDIKIAILNKKNATDTYHWQIMEVVRDVQVNYWTLVNRIRRLAIERESLRRAKRLLADNRARLRVGTMSRADVIESEAQAAEQQKRIIAARYDLLIAENDLKKTMNDPHLTVLTDIAVVPIDQPTSAPKEIDWVYCVDRALNLRPDFAALKAQLESNKVAIKQRKNELYPEIDMEGSLELNGLGTSLHMATDVMSPFYDENFYDAYIGVKVTFPLGGNRAAKANYRTAQLQAAQALRNVKNAELEIIRQVREAVRYVKNYYEVSVAAKTVRELRERQLEAKEIKRKAGTGIPFEVVQAQEDLVNAEGAELDALINYNIWLARLSYRMGTILDELHIEVEEKPEKK